MKKKNEIQYKRNDHSFSKDHSSKEYTRHILLQNSMGPHNLLICCELCSLKSLPWFVSNSAFCLFATVFFLSLGLYAERGLNSIPATHTFKEIPAMTNNVPCNP